MSSDDSKPISQVAIIGVGQVGAAAACALVLGSIPSELLLVDVRLDLRDSQVSDLSDTAYVVNSGTRVRAATYREASQSDIVVITAGSRYSIGETSLQHMYRNIGIVRSIVNAMKPFRPDTILLIVANPNDLLTEIAQELSGLPRTQVMGSGTFLDSVRLRWLLAQKAGVAPSSIDIYVLGRNDDSQVVAWPTATIGGVPIANSLPPNTINKAELAEECRDRSKTIIQTKGAIPFGIGSIVSSICSSVLFNRQNVRPICHFQSKYDCCLSMPAVLGRTGIIRTIQVPLHDQAEAILVESARELRKTIKRIHEDA